VHPPSQTNPKDITINAHTIGILLIITLPF